MYYKVGCILKRPSDYCSSAEPVWPSQTLLKCAKIIKCVILTKLFNFTVAPAGSQLRASCQHKHKCPADVGHVLWYAFSDPSVPAIEIVTEIVAVLANIFVAFANCWHQC